MKKLPFLSLMFGFCILGKTTVEAFNPLELFVAHLATTAGFFRTILPEQRIFNAVSTPADVPHNIQKHDHGKQLHPPAKIAKNTTESFILQEYIHQNNENLNFSEEEAISKLQEIAQKYDVMMKSDYYTPKCYTTEWSKGVEFLTTELGKIKYLPQNEDYSHFFKKTEMETPLITMPDPILKSWKYTDLETYFCTVNKENRPELRRRLRYAWSKIDYTNYDTFSWAEIYVLFQTHMLRAYRADREF
jgi:hypothetical protein